MTIKKTIYILLIILPLIGLQASAQNILTGRYGNHTDSLNTRQRLKGNIKIIQDDRIKNIVNKHIRIKRLNGGVMGWRIQLYYGHSEDEANKVKSDFFSVFPELYDQCLVKYEDPNFRTVVGKFTDEVEVYRFHKNLLQKFPNSYRIRQKINFSELIEIDE